MGGGLGDLGRRISSSLMVVVVLAWKEAMPRFAYKTAVVGFG